MPASAIGGSAAAASSTTAGKSPIAADRLGLGQRCECSADLVALGGEEPVRVG